MDGRGPTTLSLGDQPWLSTTGTVLGAHPPSGVCMQFLDPSRILDQNCWGSLGSTGSTASFVPPVQRTFRLPFGRQWLIRWAENKQKKKQGENNSRP